MWGRRGGVARWGVQAALAAALVAGHVVSSAPYVYPHYVLLVLGHPWLCRRFGVRLADWQVVYVSVALFLHPVGGLFGLYASVWWYDHLTHFLSATLVGSVGYLLVRGTVDRTGPTWRTYAFTVAWVLAAGLLWEVIEELTPLLTVYGPNDTLWDVVFDAVGGAVVAAFGEAVLARPVAGFQSWVARRRGK